MENLYRGIIPPLITPLINSTTIDEEGLTRLLMHVLSGGVHGLFLLGSTGEATSLNYKIRELFVHSVCRQVNNMVPVLVGITDTCMENALDMAECYKEAGADAVVVAPPYYIPLSQGELMQYLEELVPRLALPFFLYNMPAYTKLHISLETVSLAEKLGALGIKDSSGDQVYTYKLIDRFKNSPCFSIFTGTEIFLPETIMQGGHGAVAGGSNIFPQLYVDFFNASVENDIEKITVLRNIVLSVYNTVYDLGENASRYILGIKCALSVMGICDDYAAPPLRKFGEEKRHRMEQVIRDLKETLSHG